MSGVHWRPCPAGLSRINPSNSFSESVIESEWVPILYLYSFCNIVQQSLRIFPAKARVSDGLAVDMVLTAHLLVAFNDIALNHHTFDKLADVIGMLTAA